MNHFIFRSTLYFLLAAALWLPSCRGQNNPAAPAQPAPTEAALLPSDTATQISEYVVEVFEDSRGSLWFGTVSDGAARFDGHTLTYFSTKDGLCDNTVASIVEDKQGNMWFGTHNGVSKYDPRMGVFVNFGKTEGMHGMGCKLIIDRNGTIWAGTNDGAFRFNGVGFAAFDLPKPVVPDASRKWVAGKVWNILEDSKGNIWFARDAYGACKYDPTAAAGPGAFTHFTKKDGLCSNNVCDIAEDQQGNIWLGCLSSDLPEVIKEGGVCRYDGQKVTQFPTLEGLHHNDIYSMYADKAGNVWMGATGLGVYRYDGQSFQLFKGTDRMDLTWSVGIQSIREGRNGTMWFGFSGGLFRFDGKGIVNVPNRDIVLYKTKE